MILVIVLSSVQADIVDKDKDRKSERKKGKKEE